jgi:soluble lytic murein transglycosylase
LPRLTSLLAASCLGTAAALGLGRALLLNLQPPLTPLTGSGSLELIRRFSPDPERRREASLLLLGRGVAADDPHLARRLLRHQGWGRDPLAALVLKRDALAAEQLGQRQRAMALWAELLQRFPNAPASADALYSLGRRQGWQRTVLLRRFPSHPAALAAALEAGPAPQARRQGVLHLARWGPRWPGAEERLRQACKDPRSSWTPAQRADLASALAELGDSAEAMACLRPGSQLSPAAMLALGRALLRSDPPHQAQAAALLLQLVRLQPRSPEAEEAVRLLASAEGPAVAAALDRLPAPWQHSAPLAARQALTDGDDSRVLAVLHRWPGDPASWDLQWERTRQRLLERRWAEALRLLRAIDAASLPPPLAARQRFWNAYALKQQGHGAEAAALWTELRRISPGGYYGWRASVQLGQGDLATLIPQGSRTNSGALAAPPLWQPLLSGDAGLDRLWRLDQTNEAWEHWLNRRGPQRPRSSRDLALEGRLRQGVGDDWTALAQLDQALLNLPPGQCSLARELERSLHPVRHGAAFRQAAQDHGVSPALLLGLTKQESRFTPGVHSAAGAVGLMQLMPATAGELAGRPLSDTELEQPGINLELGSLYLQRLLLQWQGDPLRAVASYNAGPGAVQGWITPLLVQAPELWVEAIPYPETRLYVKKVLGNAWSYQSGALPAC